jgi:hypothetical protein
MQKELQHLRVEGRVIGGEMRASKIQLIYTDLSRGEKTPYMKNIQYTEPSVRFYQLFTCGDKEQWTSSVTARDKS